VLKPIRLPELIDRVLAAQRGDFLKAKVEVERHFSPFLPPAPGDASLLSLALQHLLNNAREAMPKGGVLRISLEAQAQRLKLTVQDSGAGIAPEDLPRVFDPFFSTKPQGTGMGLTAVYHIIANHLGEIEIDSTPGQGTAVHIWLPRWRLE
jgi:signal transduction histidine kinase